MNFSDLTNYNFIVLNELSSITSGMMQTLLTFVTTGGSLLIVPPADADLESYNQLLQMLHAPQLTAFNKQSAKASTINSRAMLYRNVFSAAADENMEMPTLSGYFKTSATAGTVMETAISLTGGEPYLTLTPCANGHVYLFTAPLRPPYTDFVQQALFVPTLYNMALYSHSIPPVAYTLGSEAPIILQGTYDLTARPPELTDGGQLSLLPDLRRIGSRQQLLLHGELKHDGIYTLGEEHLAFNYPRRESRMAFLERNEIAKAIDGREGLTLVRNSAKPLTDELRTRDGGHPLWRLCIVLALVALAVEVVLLKLNTKH